MAVTKAQAHDKSMTFTLPPCLAVVGHGMLSNNKLLAVALRCELQRWYPWHQLDHACHVSDKTKLRLSVSRQVQGFVGWGRKKSFYRANAIAKLMQLPVFSVEDGFLRSLYAGVDSRYGMSFVVDDVGIYFDLTQASRLENLIIQRIHQFDKAPQNSAKQHAKQLIQTIITHQLSKYNHVLLCPNLNDVIKKDTHCHTKPHHVLLIDQVQGDASIAGASANADSFARMLAVAIQCHPHAHIWIKTHPAGRGYLVNQPLPTQVRLITEAVNPIALLKQVDDVYTVSSHMGFEALLLGKKVHCHGMAWYAGWGLTDDSGIEQTVLTTVKKRRHKQWESIQKTDTYFNLPIPFGIESLFYAAYVDYSVYADPASHQACDIEQVMSWLITNRHWQQKLPKQMLVYQVSRWKKTFVHDFFSATQVKLTWQFRPKFKNLQSLYPSHHRLKYQAVLLWGLAQRQQMTEKVKKIGHTPRIYCMEDGFIRSNGLGATLLVPLSVVVDEQGIYYNATAISDLENLLANCQPLTAYQLDRVQSLWTLLLTQKISKYNVGQTLGNQHAWVKQIRQTKQQKILIVGQVEDDLSVQYCGSAITDNQALIIRVRHDYPQAYLLYKPHPDVEAGLRTGKVNQSVLSQVDAVANDVAMPDCLALVDEVHTISSLTGFEALLRQKTVVCYGLPFYAGWGLTMDADADKVPKCDYLARRQRQRANQPALTIEQLLYTVLIDYPLYRLPNGYGLAQVEQVIDYLYPQLHVKSNDCIDDGDDDSVKIANKTNNATVFKTMVDTPRPMILTQTLTQFMKLRQHFR